MAFTQKSIQCKLFSVFDSYLFHLWLQKPVFTVVQKKYVQRRKSEICITIERRAWKKKYSRPKTGEWIWRVCIHFLSCCFFYCRLHLVKKNDIEFHCFHKNKCVLAIFLPVTASTYASKHFHSRRFINNCICIWLKPKSAFFNALKLHAVCLSLSLSLSLGV